MLSEFICDPDFMLNCLLVHFFLSFTVLFFIKGTLLLAGNFLVVFGNLGSVKGCLVAAGV